ncbi:MAG: DNA-formamidopyrimidine glycosylase [Firmicutes bacterium]|nr:DNA-formamidopyrimidine glycosylase [Bacillota bacterium]
MPELPEVETVRRGLEALLVGHTIERVEVRLPRIVRSPDLASFTHSLAGAQVTAVERRGKYLLICTGDLTLVSHLRMEGRYGLYNATDPVLPHTHVLFHLADGTELRYRDVRQFGTMDLLSPGALSHWPALQTLGPEPLSDSFDVSYLQRLARKRKAPIKAVLLDQTVVAGLGNIYVDEILHRAGIHPERSAASLSRAALSAIVEQARTVIGEAIAMGGSSIKSYVNGYGAPGGYQFSLRVYGRAGQPCASCGSEIVKGRVAGRGTHVCLTCQKPPRQAAIKAERRGATR